MQTPSALLARPAPHCRYLPQQKRRRKPPHRQTEREQFSRHLSTSIFLSTPDSHKLYQRCTEHLFTTLIPRIVRCVSAEKNPDVPTQVRQRCSGCTRNSHQCRWTRGCTEKLLFHCRKCNIYAEYLKTFLIFPKKLPLEKSTQSERDLRPRLF